MRLNSDSANQAPSHILTFCMRGVSQARKRPRRENKSSPKQLPRRSSLPWFFPALLVFLVEYACVLVLMCLSLVLSECEICLGVAAHRRCKRGKWRRALRYLRSHRSLCCTGSMHPACLLTGCLGPHPCRRSWSLYLVSVLKLLSGCAGRGPDSRRCVAASCAGNVFAWCV